MKQNIYDDPTFFSGYAELRRSELGLNAALEWPAFRSLLPPLAGKRLLDLGCGFGNLCRYVRQQGAEQIAGVDISANMLARAREDGAGITYIHRPFEDVNFDPASFDVVTSSLALHYTEDYERVCSNVARWLIRGGTFAFSVEHPMMTSVVNCVAPGWCTGEDGGRKHWPVDNYRAEGIRRHWWFVDGVINYHRTVETYINRLIDSGFEITRVLEPEPTPEAIAERLELIEQCRRPPFLLIAARKG